MAHLSVRPSRGAAFWTEPFMGICVVGVRDSQRLRAGQPVVDSQGGFPEKNSKNVALKGMIFVGKYIFQPLIYSGTWNLKQNLSETKIGYVGFKKS